MKAAVAGAYTARKKSGHSRIRASMRWWEFEARLGFSEKARPIVGVKPMQYDHFKNMERRLLEDVGVHPRIISLIGHLIESERSKIDQIRSGEWILRHGDIKRLVIEPFFQLQDKDSSFLDRHVTTGQIAGAFTIVADISVIFTTRDWSVAGTLSTMAGAAMATTLV